MVYEPNESARRHFLKIVGGSIAGASIIGPASGKNEEQTNRVHINETDSWRIIKIDKSKNKLTSNTTPLKQIIKEIQDIDNILVSNNKNKYIIKCKKDYIREYQKEIKKQRKKHEEEIKNCEKRINNEMSRENSSNNKGEE